MAGRPIRRTSWIALAAILAVAAWLRLADLGERSLSHIESYTPGIEYPAGMSDPPTRSTFVHNLTWALNDVHGPLWYLAMLPYVEAFGTGLETLRAPAAAAGLGAVFFLFLFGCRAGGDATGLPAAALLALNGHHLFWSQQARFYGPACLVAVASCWALVRAAEGRRGSLAAFVTLSLAGVATIHYYWFLLAAQLAWVAVQELGERPRLLPWMLLTLVAGSPLITLALFQTRPFPYLAYDDFLLRFYSFGFLLDPNIDAGSTLVWETRWRRVLPVLTAVLAVAAWLRGGRESRFEPPAPPGRFALVGAAAAALAAIAWGYGPAVRTLPDKAPLLAASALLAVAGVLAAAVLIRTSWWERAPRPSIPQLEGAFGLALSVATVAPLSIALVSAYAPFQAPRGMLLFTPALLVVCARGLHALATPARPARLVVAGGLGAALLAAHLGGIRIVRAERGAAHYEELAEAIRPEINDDDLVLVYRHWSLTPLFYYLQDRYDQFVGADWKWRTAAEPDARIWVLQADMEPPPAAVERAVGERGLMRRFDAAGVRAELYSRR